MTGEHIPDWAIGAGDVHVYLVRNDGWLAAVDSTQNPTTLPINQNEIAVAAHQSDQSVRTVQMGDSAFRVVAVPFGSQYALVLAQNMAPQERALQRMGAVMLLFGLAGVIGAAAAGWAVSRNGLRPVRRLTRNVERMARTQDLQPLPVVLDRVGG